MPIYEYRRPDGTTFDVIQKFSDDALTKDPETGVPVERVYTAPAIHFKGSGFHNTDYGSKRRPKSGSGGGESESSSSSSGGSDAKTGSASKSEPSKKASETKSSDKKTSKSSD